ncbi:ribonuclease HII [uncultured Salinisphaera sp.]|uniref:ribonuclease HII n=1 Tax=uncultured Salinisphaera sp. TaxID=359372 RepID=UPI0032B1D41A
MTGRRQSKFACPFVAGVDEVGRGPLAGPVVAAAVIMPARGLPRGLTDSKALSETERAELNVKIRQRALAFCIAEADVSEIDRLNILQATLLAMRRAVAGLARRPTAVWVDGNRSPGLSGPIRCVVGGDGQVPAISAASVIAKVARDAQMARLDAQFPGYGLAAHKGYGTAFHREALMRLGPSPIHRRSFAPVARAMAATQSRLDLG